MTQFLEKIHGFVTQPSLFVALGLVCIFFGIASFVLMFHWTKYAVDKSAILTAQAAYYLGGALILVIGFISILLY